MRKFFVLLNHQLTEAQLEEIYNMGVDEIVLPPEDIVRFWKDIAPAGELPDAVTDVIKWLKSGERGDYALIQGDFGATFYVVSWCLDNGFIPVYSTTKRVFESEIVNGEIVNKHTVKHVNFRKYTR